MATYKQNFTSLHIKIKLFIVQCIVVFWRAGQNAWLQKFNVLNIKEHKPKNKP